MQNEICKCLPRWIFFCFSLSLSLCLSLSAQIYAIISLPPSEIFFLLFLEKMLFYFWSCEICRRRRIFLPKEGKKSRSLFALFYSSNFAASRCDARRVANLHLKSDQFCKKKSSFCFGVPERAWVQRNRDIKRCRSLHFLGPKLFSNLLTFKHEDGPGSQHHANNIMTEELKKKNPTGNRTPKPKVCDLKTPINSSHCQLGEKNYLYRMFQEKEADYGQIYRRLRLTISTQPTLHS